MSMMESAWSINRTEAPRGRLVPGYVGETKIVKWPVISTPHSLPFNTL